MKLDNVFLEKTTQAAFTNVVDKAKQPHETHEQFIARCWFLAFQGVAKKGGYEVAFIDPSTGSSVICELPDKG